MTDATSPALGRILIVGGGNMGGAICAGLVGPAGHPASLVEVADPSADKRDALASSCGVSTVASVDCASPADTVLIAVKPNIASDVCAQISSLATPPTRVVSIAAGVSTSTLESALPAGMPVVRVMPNTPLLVGEGMACVCAGASAERGDVDAVREMFSCMGRAAVVDESQMDAVTALSGSGPAYFELVAQTLARAAADEGLEYDLAVELALQTMLGTARLVQERGQPLDEAIRAVSSPGGTTVAALQAMREGGIEEALADGVAAASRRSAELGGRA